MENMDWVADRRVSDTGGTYTFDFSDVKAKNEDKAAFFRWFYKMLARHVGMNTKLYLKEDLEEDQILNYDFEFVCKFDDLTPCKYGNIIEKWFEWYGWDKRFFEMKGLELVIDYYSFVAGFLEKSKRIHFDSGFLIKQKVTIKVTSDRITRHYDTYLDTVCNPYTLLEYTPYDLKTIYDDFDENKLLTELYGEEVLIRDEEGFLSKEAYEITLRLGKEAHLRYQEENKTM
ncbi:hypothetical protein [Rodentibacter trehalosifermentans]|uniref:hypothetical protein n=1 Tax=Rodentibacter trehalosifermentans TaxID=1908263 RepID=UPI000984187B|nr:hypothetical protein [Rodentibacter trehalosifermentans]OOF52453.1 hypothetical protein BKK53_04980 [Rodentibacter trehalosifermentans]